MFACVFESSSRAPFYLTVQGVIEEQLPAPVQRPRSFYFCLLLFLPPLGLGVRSGVGYLPPFLVAYLPDTLWAVLVFALAALLLPRRSLPVVAGVALLFAFGIECSQLYHAVWLDGIRSSQMGALLLGRGFLWSDLACYFCGVGFGALLDWMVTDSRDIKNSSPAQMSRATFEL